ncbi:uncharacterized protein LOC128999131 isoform X2 [Macrosteles quadrilineatus]|nr:uncharacterized protein LOC128999131 isoform X2 [Macrosteles quadrilineatus]
MLEELSEEMRHLTHLRCHHLHMMITENLQEWTTGGIADQMMAFHLISTRCKKLKTLNMSYVRHLNHRVFMTLVPTLTNIVSLDLRMTLTVDEVVDKIGACCKQLVDLNLSGTPITDKGLVHLCLSSTGERRSQKLVRLSVGETWISVAGATVVLQFLPNLREFDFDNIFEAIEQVDMWDQQSELCLLTRAGVRVSATPANPPSRLRLTCLNSTVECVREESVEATVRLCPDATNVAISNSWLPNESLYKLMVLENLSALSLSNSEGCTFTFQEGVLPVLSVCGNKLHSLILSNFPGIDIAGIGRSCPNLQNLAFSNVPVFYMPSQPCPEWFNKLEALELWSVTNIELSPILIKQLVLFSPIMRNVLFNSCNILTDALLMEIIQANPLNKLSHLTIDHCHGVTMATINTVLDIKNELNVLRIWSCAGITRTNSEEISRRITDENLDIYFEWFQFT